jgi:hypothetical protein
MATFKRLKEVANSERNYADYRKVLKDLLPPCLPFMGVYLTDLIFIDEGNTDFKKAKKIPGQEEPAENEEDKMIVNFTKYLQTVIRLNEIGKFQGEKYDIKENSNLQIIIKRWIESADLTGDVEDRLYKLSLKVEPRG